MYLLILGIALMLMGFLPLVEALRLPVVGFTTLGILLYALIARGPLPLSTLSTFSATTGACLRTAAAVLALGAAQTSPRLKMLPKPLCTPLNFLATSTWT